MASRALGDLVRKLGERVLPEVIPHLEEGLNFPEENKRRGVCNGLIEIMRSCTIDQISAFSDRLTSPIRRSLTDPSPEVRKAGARAFELLYNGIHLRAVDSILPDIFAHLDDPASKEAALDGIRQLLALRGRAVMPYLVPKLTQPTLDAKTFAYLAPIAGDALSRHLGRILPSFLIFAASIPAAEKTNVDLDCCNTVLSAIGDVSGVRMILQELISGLSLTESAAASQITVQGLRPSSTSYCYASLRLLHVYLGVMFAPPAEDEKDAAQLTSAVQRRDLAKRSRAHQGNGSAEESDEDDDDDDEDDESFESDEEDESEDEDDDNDEEEDDGRPSPKEVVHQLMPDYLTFFLRNLTKLLTVNDETILSYAWSCLEVILKVKMWLG